MPDDAEPGARLTHAPELPPEPHLDMPTERLHEEVAEEEAQTPPLTAVPPPLSGNKLLGRSLARWLTMGAIRYLYRRWTRIAVHVFPENSLRAHLARALHIPLPDALNLSWITTDLAVGGRVMPEDIGRLAASGVSAVVDTRSEFSDDEAVLAGVGIRFLYLPTPDTYPLSVEQLCEGARWINQQIAEGRRVLVHCEHGVGRSVLLSAASLVATGLGAYEAMDLVQRKRWQAAPNHRQMRRLLEFERYVRENPAHAC